MSYQSMMLDSMNDGMHEQNIIKTKSKNVLLFGATQATPDQRSPLTPDNDSINKFRFGELEFVVKQSPGLQII